MGSVSKSFLITLMFSCIYYNLGRVVFLDSNGTSLRAAVEEAFESGILWCGRVATVPISAV
jgi:hypothetical protein